MKTEVKPNINRPVQPVANGGVYRKYIKRLMDFILSLIAIIALSPVLLALAILVSVKLGSPVLFKQKRPGLNEKIFTLYKFRTMTDERNEDGELQPDSVRLTKFGKFLRSTSLDELPELINIIKGDMAIVGPRPLLVRYLPYYKPNERERHAVRPGLTGLAQISGRNSLSWDDRFATDIEYVSRVSYIADAYIVLKTIKKVLLRRDVAVVANTKIDDLDIQRRHMKEEWSWKLED